MATTTQAIAPVALIILSAGLAYVAYGQRRKDQQIMFEIFFMFAGLLSLAAVMTLFNSLLIDGISFKDVVLPVFGALFWIYIILVFIVFVRLLIHAFELVKMAIQSFKNRGKR